MTAPVPGALSTNTTTACPFCKKEITSHYFYNHISRSHFFDVWAVDANRTKLSGAIARSSASCNPVSVDIGPVAYLLNPINGRVYTSMKTWDKSMKNVSVDEYKKALQAILDYRESNSNSSTNSPALDAGEVVSIQKVVNGLVKRLDVEIRGKFESDMRIRALEKALSKYMSEEEIENLILDDDEVAEREAEFEYYDTRFVYKRDALNIKSITLPKQQEYDPPIARRKEENAPKGPPLPSSLPEPVKEEPKPQPDTHAPPAFVEPVITEPAITAPVIGLPTKQLTVPRPPPVTFTPPQPEPTLQFPPVISNTKTIKVKKTTGYVNSNPKIQGHHETVF